MQGTPEYPVFFKLNNSEISDDQVVAQAKETEVMNRFEEAGNSRGARDSMLKQSRLEVRQFRNDSRHFISLSVIGSDVCNEVSANMFMLWEVRAGRFILLNDPQSSRVPFVPEHAADVNNDGSPEFYGEGMVVRESGGTFQVVEDLRPVDFRGGC
jgi:hypothetical protein